MEQTNPPEGYQYAVLNILDINGVPNEEDFLVSNEQFPSVTALVNNALTQVTKCDKRINALQVQERCSIYERGSTVMAQRELLDHRMGVMEDLLNQLNDLSCANMLLTNPASTPEELQLAQKVIDDWNQLIKLADPFACLKSMRYQMPQQFQTKKEEPPVIVGDLTV